MISTISVRAYRIAVGCILALWALLWAVAYPNVYGWFTDDVDIFSNFYDASSPRQFIDPLFFHAYYWLIGFPMTFSNMHVPSYAVPLTGGPVATEVWRADIAVTILLHGVLLVLAALFVTKVLGRTLPALFAFVLFAISPTFTFYTPLLDSRFLGLLFWIPGMLMLFRLQNGERTLLRSALLAFAAGLCLSIGQDIHYTTAYLGLPFAVCFWALLGVQWRLNRRWIAAAFAFAFGAVIYWAFIEGVHHVMLALGSHGYDPIEVMFDQRGRHLSGVGLRGNIEIWKSIFVGQMGWPMIVLTLAGLFAAWKVPRDSPAAFRAATVALTAFAGSFFLFISPTMPFYRQVSGLQLFYAILAAMAAAYAVSFLRPVLRTPVLVALLVVAAALPAVRSAEIYQAHQGFGRVLAYANKTAGADRTWFFQEKWRPVPMALNELGPGGSRLKALPAGSVLITEFPIFDSNPFMLAILHDTKPLVRYPSEWCTHEQYAELQAFNGFDKYQDEREKCEARVYAVKDILAQLDMPALPPVRVWTGSTYYSIYPPVNIFGQVKPLWVSNDNRTKRPFVEADFDRPAKLSAATIVSPDRYYGGGRIKEIEVSAGASASGPLKLIWHGRNLSDVAVFTATFPRQPVRRIRFTIVQQDGRTETLSGAIKQVVFPGYRVEPARVR